MLLLRRIKLAVPIFLLVLTILMPGAAVGRPYNAYCASVPRLHWLSAEEVEGRLKELGLSLVRLRMADDRCYAVHVRDQSGKLHDLIMHPVTAAIVRWDRP